MRTKQIQLTPEALFGLIAQVGNFECCTLFPDDCRGLRCGIDPSGNVVLLIESSTFPEIGDGMAMETICPVYEAEPVSMKHRLENLELAFEQLKREVTFRDST